ncbi:MAG: hypothetical protein K0S30_1090 [Clostridia bacterium]|nr:hypothetical protein [Clostridia bacterium]
MKLLDKDAILLWETVVNGELVGKSQPVFVSEGSVTRQEFYVAQQSGMNPSIVFTLNTIDYDLTKHLEQDTNKPLYATKIQVDGAVYDIIRTYKPKDSEEIELICG